VSSTFGFNICCCRLYRLALREKYNIKSANKSDCQVIGHLYEEKGPEFIRELDGMFAFVIEDHKDGTIMVGAVHKLNVSPHRWPRSKSIRIQYERNHPMQSP
jgi:hypothetical protein